MANSTMQSPSETFETHSERVYRSLRHEITTGKLKPGTRLVRRTLGKRYGVSPITVTEALWKLELDGLVESVAMYGSRVSVLTLEKVQNEQVLREALETQAARLCARNATQNQLDELYARADLVDKMMARQEPYSPEGVKEHSNFHLALARFSGYPLLARELEKVWFRQLMFFNWVSSFVNPVPPEWHRRLVAAVASRDLSEADSVMREHVYFGHDHQMEVIRRIEEGVAPVEPQD